jgi:hypothetical protein
MLQNSDRVQDNGRPITGNTNRLLGKIGQESGRIEMELGKTEPSSDKERPVLANANQLPGNIDWLSGKVDLGTEPGSGEVELGPGCEDGLREEVRPTLVERFKEESITKKNEVGKVGSPIDKEKMEPMKEYD